MIMHAIEMALATATGAFEVLDGNKQAAGEQPAELPCCSSPMRSSKQQHPYARKPQARLGPGYKSKTQAPFNPLETLAETSNNVLNYLPSLS